MTKDLAHLGTLIDMIQVMKNKRNIMDIQIKALERSQYLLEKTA
jgi:hypothetical protein